MSLLMIPYSYDGSDRYARDLHILINAWKGGVDLGSRKYHIQSLIKGLETNLAALRSELAALRELDDASSPDVVVFVESASELIGRFESIIAFATPLGS